MLVGPIEVGRFIELLKFRDALISELVHRGLQLETEMWRLSE